MTKFDLIYRNILEDIMTNGIEELNQRTGVKVKALPGVHFSIDLEKDGFPLLSLRKLPLSFIPEIMWMLSGSNTTEWLSRHTKIWDFFTEYDGKITSAYGYRWRVHFGVDQITEVLEKLRKNPSDRHGVVMMWSPKEDLLLKQKNVPCPFTFTLNIIGGRLHLHLVIRSNDMILGNPTDVAGFALLQHIFAELLNVTPGIFSLSISNAHIYENQYEVAKELLSRSSKSTHIRLKLPKDAYARACILEDDLIEDIKNGIIGYKPEDPIKNIPIAI